MLDIISPSSFEATYVSSPDMNVWFEVINIYIYNYNIIIAGLSWQWNMDTQIKSDADCIVAATPLNAKQTGHNI